MIAAVLCGGKGTRLRDVIGQHQKCAVDVGGKPWIARILDVLDAAGVSKALLLTGYKGEEIVAAALAWKKEKRRLSPAGRDVSMAVDFLHSRPSGTSAAIYLAFAKTKERALLVVNGDTIIPGLDLQRLVEEWSLSPKQTVAIRARSAITTEVADAGIMFRVQLTDRLDLDVPLAFLDIGSPEGLAEARRRFVKREYCRPCDIRSMKAGGAIGLDGHLSTGCVAKGPP